MNAFCGDLLHIPLCSNSIDVVITSHAIEPNGGKETKILKELLRVCKKHLILFEPSYENNSIEGKKKNGPTGVYQGASRRD